MSDFVYTHPSYVTSLFGIYMWYIERVADQLIDLANTSCPNDKSFGVQVAIAIGQKTPSIFFNTCVNNGKLEKYFPELFACIGCTQDERYHIDDVYNHTMIALDRTASLPEVLTFNTKMALLFHDLGKAPTRRVESIVE